MELLQALTEAEEADSGDSSSAVKAKIARCHNNLGQLAKDLAEVPDAVATEAAKDLQERLKLLGEYCQQSGSVSEVGFLAKAFGMCWAESKSLGLPFLAGSPWDGGCYNLPKGWAERLEQSGPSAARDMMRQRHTIHLYMAVEFLLLVLNYSHTHTYTYIHITYIIHL